MTTVVLTHTRIPAAQALDSGKHSCSASNCSAAAADCQLQPSAYNSLIPLAVLSQMSHSAVSPTMLSALVLSPAVVADAECDSWPPEASCLNLQQAGFEVVTYTVMQALVSGIPYP